MGKSDEVVREVFSTPFCRSSVILKSLQSKRQKVTTYCWVDRRTDNVIKNRIETSTECAGIPAIPALENRGRRIRNVRSA